MKILRLYILFIPLFIDNFNTYAVTVGPTSSTTNATSDGTGNGTWSTLGGHQSSNNTYSSCTINKNKTTDNIVITSFNFSGIPNTAIIDGIVVEVERYSVDVNSGGATRTDASVKLVVASTISGTSQAPSSGSATWASADPNSYVTYGSSTNTWGLTLFGSDVNVNSAAFGVAISASTSNTGGGTDNYTFYIDHVRMTIYYSPGFTAANSTAWNLGTTWGGACAAGCTAGTDYPNASSSAYIAPGKMVTIPAGFSAACNTLIVSSTSATSSTAAGVSFSSSTASLAVGSSVIMNAGTSGTPVNNINLNGGTMTVGGDLTLTGKRNGGSNYYSTMTIGGGALTVTGNITLTASHAAANSVIDASTANSTINIGGSFSFTNSYINNSSGASGTINYNGSSSQTLETTTGSASSGIHSYYNLTTSGGGLKTMDGNATVNNRLTMTSGNINGAGFTLTIGNSAAAALVYTAGRFYGGTWKRWFPTGAITSNSGNYYGTFPISNSAAAARGIEINSTSNVTTAGYLEASHTDGTDATTANFSADGITIQATHDQSYTLLRTGGTMVKQGFGLKGGDDHLLAGQFNVAFYFTDFNATGTLSQMYMTKNGAQAPGSHSTTVNYTAATPVGLRTGLTAANLDGTWKIGTSNYSATPLPVTLTDLTARKVGDVVSVDWITMSETNSNHFEVERSNDGGLNYVLIGEELAAGNSSVQLNYSLIDNQPQNAINYYRLKQVDHDGKAVFYGPVALDFESVSQNIELLVFPNPVIGNNFSVKLFSEKSQEMLIVLRDVLGNEVYKKSVITNVGNNIYVVSRDEILSAGVYSVNVSADTHLSTQKVIVK